LPTGKPWKILAGHTGYVHSLSFSADSQTLATASEDKTLRLWSVATGEMQRVFNGHSNSVFAVSWLGDRLLSGSFDRSIRVWDSRSGVSLRVLQGHESGVGALGLSGGQLWSAGNDGTVRRWAVTLPFQQTLALPSAPSSTVITPTLAQIAVGFANGDLALYGSLSAKPLWQQAAAHRGDIDRLSVNHDGSLLATGSFDNSAKLWSFNTSAAGTMLQETKTLNGHSDAISALAFSPNGQTLATASNDNSIGLFSLTDNKPPRFISAAHAGKVKSVEFDATGTQLLSCGYEDRRLKLWDLSKNPATSTDFPVAKDSLLWASISPDAKKLVSVGREASVDVYDRLSTQRLYHLTGHENTVYRAVFAPDSQQLATVSNDRTLKFWQLEQGKELFSLALPTEFTSPSAVWDFDFRCLNTQCLVAVPLVRGVLQLYRLGYQSELSEDTEELKRQQLEVWRQYARTVTQLLKTHALQPAAQALRETEQIAARFNTRFPNDPASAALKKQSDCQQHWLNAGLQALPVNGDKTVKPKTGKDLAPALAKPAAPTLSAECAIILDDTLSPADKLNSLGLNLYKQQRYPEAQAQFALSLQQFPQDLLLLSNDAELALVQGDTTRLQQRLLTLQALYPKKDGVYSDSYPAIMSFLNYLADH
jgi:WD40 repeat protein/TolA-binding protein